MEKYRIYIAALKLAAADCATQKMLLPAMLEVTDEIALILHDASRLSDDLVEQGLIPMTIGSEVDALDAILESYPPEDAFWDGDGMCMSPAWGHVRALACDILRKLGETNEPPDISHIHWIPG